MKAFRPAIENNSYIAVMDSVEDMFTVMNEVAPEHLEIQLPDPMEYMSMVENAGSVFLGRYATNHWATMWVAQITYYLRAVLQIFVPTWCVRFRKTYHLSLNLRRTLTRG